MKHKIRKSKGGFFMARQVVTGKKDLTLIHSVITFIIMLVIGSIPAIAPITPLGMKILGIFVGMVYGWSTVGLIAPSILGIIMYALVGNESIGEIFMDGFGNNIVVLLFFVLTFAAAITEAGIGNFIATWLITRRFLLGKPWILTTILLLAAFLVSALVNVFGSIIICWGILYDLCKKVGYKAGDKWPAFMVFGITVAAILGSGSFAFRAVSMLILGFYEKFSGVPIDFLGFSIVFWTLSLFVMIGVCFFAKFVYRVDVAPLKNVTEDMIDKSKLKLSKFQKANMLFLIILLVGLMAPSLMPKTWAITVALTKMGSAGIIMVVVMLMMCIRVEGRSLLDFPKMAANGILWDPIILTAAALPVCNAMLADEAGIKDLLLSSLGPIFVGKSILIFAFLFFTLSLLLTNFANNGMTGMIFVSVMLALAGTLGVNAAAMTVLLVFIVHVAIITPAACPMAALMFSNEEWIKKNEILKYGILTLCWTVFVVMVIGMPMANMLF